jgi:hypothetical protein
MLAVAVLAAEHGNNLPELRPDRPPGVVIVGDSKWLLGGTASRCQRQEKWLNSIGDHQHVLVVKLSAGTAIPSVRNFSQRIILEFSGHLVRIKPRDFQVPSSVNVATGQIRKKQAHQ